MCKDRADRLLANVILSANRGSGAHNSPPSETTPAVSHCGPVVFAPVHILYVALPKFGSQYRQVVNMMLVYYIEVNSGNINRSITATGMSYSKAL